MAGHWKIAPEEWPKVVARYRDGESSEKIARAYGVSPASVLRVLDANGVVRRDLGEAQRLKAGADFETVSAVRWAELYWGPDLPGMGQLAEQFGVNRTTIHRYLHKAGIRTRTPWEQRRIDTAKGRFVCKNPGGWAHISEEERPALLQRLLEGSRKWDREHPGSRMRRATAVAAQNHRARRITQPCMWCGEPFSSTPGEDAVRQRYKTCCRSHFMKARNFDKWHPGEARPLILAKLRAAWEALPERRRSGGFYYAIGEEIGTSFGADEAEILELGLELTS